MEDIVKGQMSMDDISTGTNTQQSTAAVQNATSQDRAHDCKQRIAESVQTPSESAGRNDTALQFANRPKTATQNDFRRSREITTGKQSTSHRCTALQRMTMSTAHPARKAVREQL